MFRLFIVFHLTPHLQRKREGLLLEYDPYTGVVVNDGTTII